MNNSELLSAIQARFPQVVEIPAPAAPANLPAHEAAPYRDAHLHLQCPSDLIAQLCSFLKEDVSLAFDFLTMLTAVDYLKFPVGVEPHMDVVYHLFSMRHRHKLVIKVSLPRENAVLASVIALWPAADWQEREVYDMYGIRFDGHPNCTRILMWDGFPGWPLRKDFTHIPDRYDD